MSPVFFSLSAARIKMPVSMCSAARKSRIKSFVTGAPINEFENTHTREREKPSARSFGNKIFIMKFDLMRGWGMKTRGAGAAGWLLVCFTGGYRFYEAFYEIRPPPVTPWGMHYAKKTR